VACPEERVPEMCGIFAELHHNLEIARGWEKLRKINLLENLLLTLDELRRVTPQPALRRFVEERFRAGQFQNPDYAAWAAELRMAESTLRRRFKEETGETLHRFIQRLRIAEARRLLRDTPVPLWYVAEQCGYADEYYFNRHFHRKVGMPPSKFRKSALNGGGEIFGIGAR
jgi:AraC family transcriptional regulator of arabinose operon